MLVLYVVTVFCAIVTSFLWRLDFVQANVLPGFSLEPDCCASFRDVPSFLAENDAHHLVAMELCATITNKCAKSSSSVSLVMTGIFFKIACLVFSPSSPSNHQDLEQGFPF